MFSGYLRLIVDQSKIFVRGIVCIDDLENFWDYAKKHLAKHDGMKLDKFPLYIEEMEWRCDTRNTDRFFTIGGFSFRKIQIVNSHQNIEGFRFIIPYNSTFIYTVGYFCNMSIIRCKIVHLTSKHLQDMDDTSRYTDRFEYVEKILETQFLNINPNDILEIKALDLTNCTNNADYPISHSFCIFYKGEKRKYPNSS